MCRHFNRADSARDQGFTDGEQAGHRLLNLQALNDAAILNVLENNLVNVALIYVGVPNIIWVDDQHRALGTTIQTAGEVDAHLALAIQIQLLDAILGVTANALRVVLIATRAAVVALVDTEKNVMPVVTHGNNNRKVELTV